jgi:hypothetical protein
MSMSHKAYTFDWRGFELDLRPLLENALVADNTGLLETFIDDHREVLTHPYEGEPLSDDWRAALENRDVHEYGDYALTRFYNPADGCGIAEEARGARVGPVCSAAGTVCRGRVWRVRHLLRQNTGR